MPREMCLLTPRPVSVEALVAAAAEVDDQLRLRALLDGAVLQLVDIGRPDRQVAVLSLENSRLLVDSADASRVTDAELPPGEIWWTEASTTWDEVGDPGIRIARRLAELLDGRCLLSDGR